VADKNALNSLYGSGNPRDPRIPAQGSLAGKRVQTVLTPASILDALRVVFDGPIAFDPVYAESSLTDPETYLIAPWAEIWTMATQLASHDSELRDDGKDALALLRYEKKGSECSPHARELARMIRTEIRAEFADRSGHSVPWVPRTYVNPPFGDKGPECLLANFEDFCVAFAAARVECAFLCPVRSHRKWWRRDILRAADAIVFLDPLKFEGFAQSFPAPLCLAYKGPNVERVTPAFAKLGDTVLGSARWK
jgi:hypothetical protein